MLFSTLIFIRLLDYLFLKILITFNLLQEWRLRRGCWTCTRPSGNATSTMFSSICYTDYWGWRRRTTLDWACRCTPYPNTESRLDSFNAWAGRAQFQAHRSRAFGWLLTGATAAQPGAVPTNNFAWNWNGSLITVLCFWLDMPVSPGRWNKLLFVPAHFVLQLWKSPYWK